MEVTSRQAEKLEALAKRLGKVKKASFGSSRSAYGACAGETYKISWWDWHSRIVPALRELGAEPGDRLHAEQGRALCAISTSHSPRWSHDSGSLSFVGLV